MPWHTVWTTLVYRRKKTVLCYGQRWKLANYQNNGNNLNINWAILKLLWRECKLMSVKNNFQFSSIKYSQPYNPFSIKYEKIVPTEIFYYVL